MNIFILAYKNFLQNYNSPRKKKFCCCSVTVVIPVREWCDCIHCRVLQNPTKKMIQCCHMHHSLDQKLEDINWILEHKIFNLCEQYGERKHKDIEWLKSGQTGGTYISCNINLVILSFMWFKGLTISLINGADNFITSYHYHSCILCKMC